MSIAISASRDKRGTKRTCTACDIPFYDLMRDPIVCPACGGEHTPIVRPPLELAPAPYSGSSGWRSRAAGARVPALPEAEAIQSTDGDEVAAEDLEEVAQDATEIVADDDTVLEPESDDADASALVEHEAEEPKEQ